MTQLLSRTTTLIDGRKTVKMTGKVYLRAILPIGFFFSLSLICGNQAYLYLSVAFIQMLKATMPVAVLITSWILVVAPVNLKQLGNVSFIVIGVIIASIGEIKFDLTGFMWQAGGISFEATRLVMVQRLLSSAEYKMDPLTSLVSKTSRPTCPGSDKRTVLFRTSLRPHERCCLLVHGNPKNVHAKRLRHWFRGLGCKRYGGFPS